MNLISAEWTPWPRWRQDHLRVFARAARQLSPYRPTDRMRSWEEHRRFLRADRVALRVAASPGTWLKHRLLPDSPWPLQKRLRLLELLCDRSAWRPIYLVLKLGFLRRSQRLGMQLPEGVFGPGLAIVHPGSIVVNAATRVGHSCRVHQGVCLGAAGGRPEAPTLGDNVYLGPGAKVFGGIVIGSNTVIGANSTVSRSFPEGGGLLAGSPARWISRLHSQRIEAPG